MTPNDDLARAKGILDRAQAILDHVEALEDIMHQEVGPKTAQRIPSIQTILDDVSKRIIALINPPA